jgi:hypothetical protein
MYGALILKKDNDPTLEKELMTGRFPVLSE